MDVQYPQVFVDPSRVKVKGGSIGPEPAFTHTDVIVQANGWNKVFIFSKIYLYLDFCF